MIKNWSRALAVQSTRYITALARNSRNERAHSTFPIPLVERVGKSFATAEEVLNWRAWARSHASGVSEKAKNDREFPSLASLYTEVDWIVEDIVAGVHRSSRPDAVGLSGLIPLVDNDGNFPGNQIVLRENLEELVVIWKKRLRERVPLQYLTSTSHWRDLVLVVTPAVLIPRPETEHMVDIVADALLQRPSLADAPWVDLGTGSGALAISIAAELSKMQRPSAASTSEHHVSVHAVDLSPRAVSIARHNVKKNASLLKNGSKAVRVHEGSWFQPLEKLFNLANVLNFEGSFAGIVSNPPYIPSGDVCKLQAEVRLHEPWQALEGGTGQGIDELIDVCSGASVHLMKGGFLVLETNGWRQVNVLIEFLTSLHAVDFHELGLEVSRTAIFENIQVHTDYAGVKRFISAWKSL